MAKATAPTFDFLTDYLLAILEEKNINLSDEQKRAYMPEFLAEVEQRLGTALLLKLPDDRLALLNDMMEKEDTSPEAWEAFWRESLPTFEEDVKTVLRDFALEVNDLLAA